MPTTPYTIADLEHTIKILNATIDRHIADRRRLAALLKTFHQSPVSLSSLQPILTLAEELNPELRHA